MEGPVTRTSYGDVPGRKDTMLRDGTGVPMIVDWPKYREQYNEQGHSLDDLIDFSDFFATITELADTKVAYPVDGISFAPRLRGEGKNDRDFVFCHYWDFGRRAEGARDSIHDQRWKIYNDGSFFDMKNDPDEKQALKVEDLNEQGIMARGRLMASYHELRAMTLPVAKVSDFKKPPAVKKKKKSNKKKQK